MIKLAFAMSLLLTTPLFADDLADAKALLKTLMEPKADTVAITKTLMPSKADYGLVFNSPKDAANAEKAYESLWKKVEPIAPKSGQTELLIWEATSEEIDAWKGEAASHFPGGYKSLHGKFKPGLKHYAFKFVKPGESTGMAYAGLIRVGGQWRFFPKPWKAVAK